MYGRNGLALHARSKRIGRSVFRPDVFARKGRSSIAQVSVLGVHVYVSSQVCSLFLFFRQDERPSYKIRKYRLDLFPFVLAVSDQEHLPNTEICCLCVITVSVRLTILSGRPYSLYEFHLFSLRVVILFFSYALVLHQIIFLYLIFSNGPDK